MVIVNGMKIFKEFLKIIYFIRKFFLEKFLEF